MPFEEITKLEIAKMQLDRALTLFLDDKDYISAITLAGACDEILGGLLKTEGRTSAYESMKHGFEQIYRLLHKEDPEESAFNELANGVRNGLKHYQTGSIMRFSPISAAVDILDRASSNYWHLTQDETVNMERFKEFQRNNTGENML